MFRKERAMNFKTNKEKGNSGLGMAIAYFTTNGYVVSIPLNDTQDYDFLFVLNEKLEMYLIPKNKISNKSTLNLCDKYIKYKVKI